jgi:glutaredoxin
MKPVLMFILKSCPYCQQALSWMEELKKENPQYLNVEINIIDEGERPEEANRYDYYYVPTYYIAGDKVHEGVATKDIVRGVLEKAIQ